MSQRWVRYRRTAGSLIALAASALAQPGAGQGVASDKSRVLVLTDIGNEPDDAESFVRLLLYANQLDIEGLVATTSTWQRA